MSGTLRGSLNSPSLFWLDEGEPGADCSVLSSCCSWKRIRTAVRSCLHDFCGKANKPRKHRGVFPFRSQEESLGDYVAAVASVSVRFRRKAAERGTRNEERDSDSFLSFVDLSLLRNHTETLPKQVRDYNRLETLTFFCRCLKKKKMAERKKKKGWTYDMLCSITAPEYPCDCLCHPPRPHHFLVSLENYQNKSRSYF